MNICSTKNDAYKNIIQYNQSINHKLNDVIKPLLIKYQIKYFYYVRFLKEKSFFICTDINYLTQVVETKLFATMSPIFLEEISKLKKGIPRKFIWTGSPPDKVHQMLCDFDIWNGYTIYERMEDGLEIWGVGTTKNNVNIINFYLNESHILKNFILYFKDKQEELINVSKLKIFIPSDFELIVKPEYHYTEDYLYLDKNISRFYFSDKHYLTQRELECMAGMVNLKSSKEIARDLGISCRTVEKHLENIKYRFKSKRKEGLFKFIFNSELINHFFLSDLLKFIRSDE